MTHKQLMKIFDGAKARVAAWPDWMKQAATLANASFPKLPSDETWTEKTQRSGIVAGRVRKELNDQGQKTKQKQVDRLCKKNKTEKNKNSKENSNLE